MPMIPTVFCSGSLAGFNPAFHSFARTLTSARWNCLKAEIVRYAATVAVASSTAPGVLDTSIPRAVAAATSTEAGQHLADERWGWRQTLIVSRAVVGYVLDALRQMLDQILIEDANRRGTVVMPVYADGPVVLASGFTVGVECLARRGSGFLVEQMGVQGDHPSRFVGT